MGSPKLAGRELWIAPLETRRKGRDSAELDQSRNSLSNPPYTRKISDSVKSSLLPSSAGRNVGFLKQAGRDKELRVKRQKMVPESEGFCCHTGQKTLK